jgi:hypothetical protein
MGAVIVIAGIVLFCIVAVALAEQQVIGGKLGEKIGYGCAFSFMAAVIVFVWVVVWAFNGLFH